VIYSYLPYHYIDYWQSLPIVNVLSIQIFKLLCFFIASLYIFKAVWYLGVNLYPGSDTRKTKLFIQSVPKFSMPVPRKANTTFLRLHWHKLYHINLTVYHLKYNYLPYRFWCVFLITRLQEIFQFLRSQASAFHYYIHQYFISQ